jgi:D-inositol-3-phosphate glycosyltransferase
VLKIAMVSEHASPLAMLGGVDAGGQNVHVAALSEAMGRQGAEVVVYTRRDDPSLPKRVRYAHNVTVEHVDAGPAAVVEKDKLLPYMGRFAEILNQRWQRFAPDVVHAHFWMSGMASMTAAADLGIPVVQTFHALGLEKRRHQGDKDTSPASRLETELRIATNAQRIVATASAEAFELMRMGAPAHNVAVVPCGVDLTTFQPVGDRETRGERYRIVCLSRMVERKGNADVIEALAGVPDTELIIAGGPEAHRLDADPEACRLRAVAKAAGVSDRVHFRGRVPRSDVPALLRSAHAVVCYPWYEPFGIVPLEAMACAVPVVVSSVGGLVDSVVDGVTGLHVPPRSPDSLAEVLRELLPDERRRRELGVAAAKRANERYGWARIASDTLAVYSDIRVERYFSCQAS